MVFDNNQDSSKSEFHSIFVSVTLEGVQRYMTLKPAFRLDNWVVFVRFRTDGAFRTTVTHGAG